MTEHSASVTTLWGLSRLVVRRMDFETLKGEAHGLRRRTIRLVAANPGKQGPHILVPGGVGVIVLPVGGAEGAAADLQGAPAVAFVLSVEQVVNNGARNCRKVIPAVQHAPLGKQLPLVLVGGGCGFGQDVSKSWIGHFVLGSVSAVSFPVRPAFERVTSDRINPWMYFPRVMSSSAARILATCLTALGNP